MVAIQPNSIPAKVGSNDSGLVLHRRTLLLQESAPTSQLPVAQAARRRAPLLELLDFAQELLLRPRASLLGKIPAVSRCFGCPVPRYIPLLPLGLMNPKGLMFIRLSLKEAYIPYKVCWKPWKIRGMNRGYVLPPLEVFGGPAMAETCPLSKGT